MFGELLDFEMLEEMFFHFDVSELLSTSPMLNNTVEKWNGASDYLLKYVLKPERVSSDDKTSSHYLE